MTTIPVAAFETQSPSDLPKDLRQVLHLASEVLSPNVPAIGTAEAIMLLHAFRGDVTCSVPLAGMPAHVGNTVFTWLLEQPCGDGSATLQEKIDLFDHPSEWDSGINDDPRIQFVRRLQGLAPLEAAAVYVAVKAWWANRPNLGDHVNTESPETLRLDDFFVIQD